MTKARVTLSPGGTDGVSVTSETAIRSCASAEPLPIRASKKKRKARSRFMQRL